MNSTKQTIKVYWEHVSRYPLLLAGLLTSLPLTVLFGNFLPPLIIANVINRIARHDYLANNMWGSFGHDIILFAVFQTLGNIIGWRVVDVFAWRLEGRVERDIARRVFAHLMDQSPTFHANHFGGSLVSQTNKLMGSYIRAADTTWFNVLPLMLGLIFASVILATRAPLYGAILIVFSIGYMVSALFVTEAVRKRSAELATAESKQTGNLADVVTNVMAVKSFASGGFERDRFAQTTENTHRHLMSLMRTSQSQQAYFNILTNGLVTIALVVATIGAVSHNTTLATVYLIISYTGMIAGNLFQFSGFALRNYNRSFGDSADMVQILHQEPAIKDPAKPETVRIARGEIVFDDVTFAHDDSNDALFHNLKLKIKAGEKVGLVGHSGSGKTTLTRLLLRFADIQSGRITIDAQDISKITQDDLRRHIAYVPQEPILFHRTLNENISYGNATASDQEVEAVAKLAHASEFINVLPDKFETLVGERGIKLSGGQRQRIAIARAMLKNAPILVLDEATAALDSESEALIQDALWKLMEGRTAIVVAHRLSTIQKMDRIIVMDDGKIIEEGSHKELLALNGTYAKLWQRQSGGFIED